MAFVDQWLGQLPDSLTACRTAVKVAGANVTGLDPKYGVLAAGLLWPVREAAAEDDQRDAVCEICGGKDEAKSLLTVIRTWPDFVSAARELSEATKGNLGLQVALEKVITYFQEALLSAEFVTIDIRDSTVQGGIVNIGGKQFFYGDVVVNIIQQAVSSCPKAPNPPKHFTGRDAEMKQIIDQLSASNVVAITAVSGFGGMGKTSLAQALCQVPDFRFKSVLWAEIKESPDVGQTLLTWGRYAKDSFSLLAETPIEQIADLVRAMLTKLISEDCGEPTLVVMDDIWNNEDCYKAIELLRRAMPGGAQILITTRDEKVVQSLQGKSLSLEGLSVSDAKDLLRKLISHSKVAEAHLDRLVGMLAGHPLALELAAASLNLAEDSAHIEDILNEYQQGIEKGTTFDAMKLDEQVPRSLNIVFDRSYRVMSDSLKAQFRALGVLAPDAPWNRPLMGAVWQVEGDKEVRAIHQELRTRGLIARVEGVDVEARFSEGWYRQHRLLRSYARALLIRDSELKDSLNLYADFITKQAEQFEEYPPEEWHTFEDYLAPHLTEVGDTLVTQYNGTPNPDAALTDRALNFALNIVKYLFNRRQVHRLTWYELGLSAAKAKSDDRQRSLFLLYFGSAWSALGDQRKALDFYDQALHVYKVLGYKGGEAEALNNIGFAWATLGDQRKALNFYENALPLYRVVNDRRGEAIALNNIGNTHSALGEKRKALDFYKQTLLLHKMAGNRGGEATVLTSIGLVWFDLSEPRKALKFYKKALPLYKVAGDRGGEATALNNMGGVWSALKDPGKALHFYEQALSFYKMVGNQGGEATALNNIGLAWFDLGDLRKALDFYKQALPLRRIVGDRRGEASTLNNISRIAFQNGDFASAAQSLRQIVIISRDIGDVSGESAYLVNLAATLQRLGQIEEAIQLTKQSLAILRKHNLPQNSAGTTVAEHERFLSQLRGGE